MLSINTFHYTVQLNLVCRKMDDGQVINMFELLQNNNQIKPTENYC